MYNKKNQQFDSLELKHTHLRGVTGSLQVTWHKEVDDWSTDSLSGQDEGEGPPEV